MESDLLTLLETTGIPTVPSNEDLPAQFEPPALLYHRVSTDPTRDLHGNIVCEEMIVQVEVLANTYAQSKEIADSVVEAVDNVTSPHGYEFWLTDRTTDPATFGIMLTFNVFFGVAT